MSRGKVRKVEKRVHPKEKSSLHLRNRHRQRYDFDELIGASPELEKYVSVNEYGDRSIDFFDSKAVVMLNRALLRKYYDITFWEIPKGYLCPPIPGRADYIHHIAELLGETRSGQHKGTVPTGRRIVCLDIGTGANMVYPIIGVKEYGWTFIASEVDEKALSSAERILTENEVLQDSVELRRQTSSQDTFSGVIRKEERIDLTVCNPPFHSSLQEAQAGTMRKFRNLKGRKVKKAESNFGGQSNELWCAGGEEAFIKGMVEQSAHFGQGCLWFSSLLSKEVMVTKAKAYLKKVKATDVRILPMSQGQKTSRVIAWTFLDAEQREEWTRERWKEKRWRRKEGLVDPDTV